MKRRRFAMPIRNWWHGLGHVQKHFVQNVGIGIAVALALELLGGRGALAGFKERVLDWQIASESGVSSGNGIAFIDIDERTETGFEDADGHPPYFTPRDALAKMIDAALGAHPAVVLVDVDLSQPPRAAGGGDQPLVEAYREVTGRTAGANGSPISVARMEDRLEHLGAGIAALDTVQRFFYGDWYLETRLRAHGEACSHSNVEQARESCVPVILSRSILPAPRTTGGPLVEEPMPSFLDPVVAKTSDVHWASATFDHDPDFVVRRWRLYEPICNGRNDPDVLPASELLAYAFGTLAPTAWTYDGMRADLRSHFVPEGCGDAEKIPPLRARGSLTVGNVTLTSDGSERVMKYPISWNDAGTSLGQVIPARRVLEPGFLRGCTDADLDDPRRICGKIVVIGSSYRNDGDFHRVPGGEMPGSLVLINAIDSLRSDAPVVDEAPLLARLALEGTLIVLLAGAFAYWHRHPTLVLVGALVLTIVTCLPLSMYFLMNRGVWFDVVLPCVGIQIHEWIARAEGSRSRPHTQKANDP